MNIKQKKFLDAFASLLAKVAKADGRVTIDEESKVDSIWRIMGLTGNQARFCSAIFKFAQDDEISLDDYVEEFINTEFGVETRGFLYNLMWEVACSDGVLHESEKSMLKTLPRKLGVEEELYEAYYAQYVSVGGKAKDREIENKRLRESLCRIKKRVEKLSQDARATGAPLGVELLWSEAASAFAAAEKNLENDNLIEAQNGYEKAAELFERCIDNIRKTKKIEQDKASHKRREAIDAQCRAKDLGAAFYVSNEWQLGIKYLGDGDVLSSKGSYSSATQKYVEALSRFLSCIEKMVAKKAAEKRRREALELEKRQAEEMSKKAEAARRKAEYANGYMTNKDVWMVAILAMTAGDREFACGNYIQAFNNYEYALNLFQKCMFGSINIQANEKIVRAYSVLGCKSTDSTGLVKRRYLLLVKQWHPDRLIADGAPKEIINVATQKMSEINEAWDIIRKVQNIQ